MKNFEQIDRLETAIARLKRSQIAVVEAHMVLQEIRDAEPERGPFGCATTLGRCQGKAVWPHIRLKSEILSMDAVIKILSDMLASAEEEEN